MRNIQAVRGARMQVASLTRRSLVAGAGIAAAGVVVGSRRALASDPAPSAEREPVLVNGRLYDAYLPTATKPTQYFYYTCEFDSAWVIMKTFGVDVPFEDQLAIVGYDRDPEPFWTDTPDGPIITGGDIGQNFCGDYTSNLVAKIRGSAMKQIFDAYDFPSLPMKSRADIETCLLAGGLVFVKCTVDFLDYAPAIWAATNGKRYRVPLGNDHAAVVMGYNADGVVIRDVLGPTNTNWDRAYEYEVPWPQFIASIESHDWDGRAVYAPGTILDPVDEVEDGILDQDDSQAIQHDDGTDIQRVTVR